MKRIILILLTVSMLALSLCACATGGSGNVVAPEGMQIASVDASPYYLFVPKGWGLTQGFGTSGAYTSDSSNVTVSMYSASDIKNDEASKTDTPAATESGSASDKSAREQYIDAYWDMCWKTYMSELRDFAVVEDGKQTLLGGYEAKQYVYTAKYENVEYKMQMTVTYSGGLMYILTYTAKSENYISHISEVEKIISEFKFK